MHDPSREPPSTISPDGTWRVAQSFEAVFADELDAPGAGLLALYAKGKDRQWDAASRIDWSQELDPDNPQQLPAGALPIADAPFLERMSARERSDIFRQYQAWSVSQFLHGEQGALLCAAKIVQQVPGVDAKLFAATQVVDEARHVEVYTRLLQKFGAGYPVTGPLQTLLGQVLHDSRWDMTYLGMQIVVEGLALAAFASIRDTAQNPLAKAVNAYVMEDEARHVAFGRLALREYYPCLTEAERREREDFLLEACHLMRDRFDAVELWRALGLPEQACLEAVNESETQQVFRASLYARLVPAAKDIGLWGEGIRSAFARMGVLGYAAVPLDTLQTRDETIARELDARRRHVELTIAGAAPDVAGAMGSMA